MEFRDEDTIKRLLMFDYFRGPDSTGLAVVSGKDAKIAKIASHPVNLFDMTSFKAILKGYGSSAFIGHNRSATKGAVNDVNAHPYRYDHIVGAHNGTLTQKSWDELQEVIGEKTGTDSQAIFACIAKIGIDETVKLLQGAWALVWYNLEEGTLNFLRNKERPFWYCYTEKFDRVFWASEHWMLKAAITAAAVNRDYKLFQDDKGFSFYATTEDWHYKYDLAELSAGSAERPKTKVKILKGKEPAPVVTHGNFPARGPVGVTGMASLTQTTSTTTSTGGTPGSPPKIYNLPIQLFPATAAEPFGDYFDKEKTEDLIKSGCTWCFGDIKSDDKGIVIFEQTEQVLCPGCSGRNQNRVYANPQRMNKFMETAVPFTVAA